MASSCTYSSIFYPGTHKDVFKGGTVNAVLMDIINGKLYPSVPCIRTTPKTQGSATFCVSSLQSSYSSVTSGTYIDISNSVSCFQYQENSINSNNRQHYQAIASINTTENSLWSANSYNFDSSMTSSHSYSSLFLQTLTEMSLIVLVIFFKTEGNAHWYQQWTKKSWYSQQQNYTKVTHQWLASYVYSSQRGGWYKNRKSTRVWKVVSSSSWLKRMTCH